MSMKIGIIGGGVVGSATARTYLEHVDEVRVWDIIPERCTHTLDEVMGSNGCDLVFICLPETKIEVPFLSNLPHGWNRSANFVIKSTVPIGFTRRIAHTYQLTNIVHSPEFLTARCAFTDAQIPARNIIGAPEWSPYHTERGCHALLSQLYTDRFPGISVLYMSSDESEAVKLIMNGFFATKVSYFNECATLSREHGLGSLNWNKVMGGVLSDGRIAHSHTKVPGPDGLYGWGGACLGKDLANLIDCIEWSGASAPVCRAVLERNKLDRERK